MPRNVHDIEWLGLELTTDGLRASLQVQQRHLSPVGRLYGGTAVAAAIVLMEEATGGAASWVTVQFASSAGLGDVLDLRVIVSAAGRRTSQLRVVATLGAAEVFVAVGAVRLAAGPGPASSSGMASPSGPVGPVDDGPGRPGPSGQWAVMPVVPAPSACPGLIVPPPPSSVGSGAAGDSHLDMGELRLAYGSGDAPGGSPSAARMGLWCRPVGTGRLSAAVLGWQADLLGFALHEPTGSSMATSLDNTVRFGPPADPVDEWVLADISGQMAVDGHGHGTVDLWSADGTLLAAASQSCVLRSAR